MLIQFLLVLAVLTILFVFVRASNAVYVQASKRVALVLFALVNIYAVMRPDDLSALAKMVGVGRGTDLVLYALVVAFMAGMFSFYQRFRVVDRRYTELARTVALREAEVVNRERGLRPAQAVVALAAEYPSRPGRAAVPGGSAPMTEPTVDIMLPHFGRVDLVQQTVRSVLAQGDPNWRLTLVDDSGELPDQGLGDWCAGLADPRVRYLRNQQNLGINRNFQRCVTLVEHPLAVIIGSDDLLLPGYVDIVRRAHRERPEVAIIQPGVQVIDEHGESARSLVDLSKRWVFAPRLSAPTVLAGERLAVSLLRGNWLYFPSLCWRSAPLRRAGFREGLSVVQDLALVIDLVLAGESLLVLPTPAFRYRRHGASVSSTHAADGRRFAEERAFFHETADRMAARGWPRAAQAARHHLASRINALTRLPRAVAHRRPDGVRTLARHAFGGRAG